LSQLPKAHRRHNYPATRLLAEQLIHARRLKLPYNLRPILNKER
jgi:hypothetical protein